MQIHSTCPDRTDLDYIGPKVTPLKGVREEIFQGGERCYVFASPTLEIGMDTLRILLVQLHKLNAEYESAVKWERREDIDLSLVLPEWLVPSKDGQL